MARTHRHLLPTVVAALLLQSCTVGPDFVRPAAPTVARYTAEPLARQTASADIAGGEPQRIVDELDIPAQWWTLFQSRELNDLIEQALRGNPNLQTAQASLRTAHEAVYAQQGAFFPSVSASYSPSRAKTAASLASVPASGAYLYSLHTAQVAVSFVPDVFGANRRQVESLEAQAEAQRFQLEAAYVTLATNIVTTAVQAASLRDQIAALERVTALQTDQLAIMQKQLALGEIAEAAVVAQQASLAQTQLQLPVLRKQLALQDDVLIALGGQLPGEHAAPRFTLAAFKLPEQVPLSLPAKLVEQRPDVRAAEANLHAASAQVGVAIANMLPQFSLDANVGSTAAHLADLFTSGTGFWSVAGNVTQPVFEGGTLLHRKRAAEAAFDQAAAQYRSVVVTAFQNVADTLQALQLDAESLRAAVDAEHCTQRSVYIARRQFELGDVSYLALLAADQAYQQALIARIQAEANRFADTAALYQALGGGWWHRNANEPGEAAQSDEATAAQPRGADATGRVE